MVETHCGPGTGVSNAFFGTCAGASSILLGNSIMKTALIATSVVVLIAAGLALLVNRLRTRSIQAAQPPSDQALLAAADEDLLRRHLESALPSRGIKYRIEADL